MGLLSMPYYFLFEMLGPIIEFSGWIFMLVFLFFKVLSVQWFLVFLAVSAAFGFLFSVATILLEEISFHRYPKRRHLFGLLVGGFLYNVGFRQINAVWRTWATLEYIVGFTKWGKMRRTGFRTEPSRQSVGR